MEPRTKTILLYTNFFDVKNWKLSAETVGPDYFRSLNCPVTDCVLTNNRHHLDSMADYDALVFHIAEPWAYSLFEKVPTLRTPSQIYVAANMESPAHTKHLLEGDANFFNWTMTYRLDSDVVWNYNNVVELDADDRAFVGPSQRPQWRRGADDYRNETLEELARRKDKMAAQFVSHCETFSGRDELVKAIQRLMPVDVYGKCGTMDYYQIVDANLENNPTTKYILTYTNFFGSNNWDLNAETVGPEYFRSLNCPVTDCIVTSRQDLLPSIAHFNALVFHAAERWSQPIPTLRSPSQFYVAAILESPAHTKHALEREAGFFNWTMTYRTDSDVVWSYARVVEDGGDQRVVAPAERVHWVQNGFRNYSSHVLLDLVAKKTKMAAQFVSHCGSISRRDRLVKQVQKFIQVDVFGSCGTMECPRGSPRCSRMLTEEYRFYFAFENSLCRDYVTEKMYNAMDNYIIPVVFGGVDYSKFVPPHSVIDVQQFGTVEELVDYLKFLADNPEEYVKYFWWKEHYRITGSQPFCELCRKLHDIGTREKSQHYRDIKAWWFDGACQARAKIEF
ncbi:hypothetical protein pipiens_005897 [Culex pipiens pipiens]|uniref:Fucosyltransferase n=1 Tax=Culex pipiens pipiens TaxID=38569 RepID=A0ABD1DX28_CULPP